MAIHAYPETYLNDAMNNLGDMLDYAVNDCGYDADDFFDRFIISGVAGFFEKGSPKYTVGLSGPELASELSYRTQGERLNQVASDDIDKSPEYWAGWIPAYYQWHSSERFSDMMSYHETQAENSRWERIAVNALHVLPLDASSPLYSAPASFACLGLQQRQR